MITLNTEQERAIDLARQNKIVALSGGAGTGKTSIVKFIAKAVKNPVLVAPTGKAANRLREATGYSAQTIHSLLQYNGLRFLKKDLSSCSVIVDEASMVDSDLMYEIIKRNPQKLILVGDGNQLPPVGNGQPFVDLFDFVGGCTLSKSYRNSGAVYLTGEKIKAGDVPQNSSSGGELFELVQTEDFLSFLSKKEINFKKDVILCCRNQTIDKINTYFREKRFGESPEPWEMGDRLICNKNISNLNFWNGSTGTVTAIDVDGKLFIREDFPPAGRTELLIDKAVKQQCSHAYAMTVHRAQGSQFERVFFVLQDEDIFFADRKLLYTAVTRAMKECYIIGSQRALKITCAKQVKRETVLQKLILGERPKNE